MAFDYPITLNLRDRICIVAGSGPLAIERVTGLLRSRAHVTVVTPEPSVALLAQCEAFNVPVVTRHLLPDDVEGAALIIVTREDDTDVAGVHEAARQQGVLFAALDDVEHCDFGAMSMVLRGSMKVAISSGGRAPALAKRLRKRLEQELEHELTELVEVIAKVRSTHRRGDIPFDEWAGRWEHALVDLDGLLGLLADGRASEVEDTIVSALQTPTDA